MFYFAAGVSFAYMWDALDHNKPLAATLFAVSTILYLWLVWDRSDT